MTQKKYTDGNGVSEIWLNIKNYVYSQLLGKADSTHTHTKSEITDFPTLATVATSGSYNDLSNKPTIPTVNNATLTIQKNGTTVKTFTANASSNVTANITVPTKVSELTNDSGFLTSHQDLSGYVPKSGGAVISGNSLGRDVDSGNIDICGGTNRKNGAFLTLRGKNNSNEPGNAILGAKDGTNSSSLILTPNGTLTWCGNAVDTIEEQGNGYIRYSNGLQICWGSISRQSNCSRAWASLYETSPISGSYAKSFVDTPSISASCNIGNFAGIIESNEGDNTSTPLFWLCRATAMNDVVNCTVRYIAIGRWK